MMKRLMHSFWLVMLAITSIAVRQDVCAADVDVSLFVAAIRDNIAKLPPHELTYAITEKNEPSDDIRVASEEGTVRIVWQSGTVHQCFVEKETQSISLEFDGDYYTRAHSRAKLIQRKNFKTSRAGVVADNYLLPYVLSPSSFLSLPDWLEKDADQFRIQESGQLYETTLAYPDGTTISIVFSKTHGLLPIKYSYANSNNVTASIEQIVEYQRQWNGWIVKSLSSKINITGSNQVFLTLLDAKSDALPEPQALVATLAPDVRIFDIETMKNLPRPAMVPSSRPWGSIAFAVALVMTILFIAGRFLLKRRTV